MPSVFLDTLADVAMTDTGDLTLGTNGDFQMATGPLAVLNSILFRLKTVEGDWQLEPQCGASLEQFFGAPNSPATGAAIESAVTDALTHDGFIAAGDLDVRAAPINVNQIVVMVRVIVNGNAVSYVGALDLREGILASLTA